LPWAQIFFVLVELKGLATFTLAPTKNQAETKKKRTFLLKELATFSPFTLSLSFLSPSLLFAGLSLSFLSLAHYVLYFSLLSPLLSLWLSLCLLCRLFLISRSLRNLLSFSFLLRPSLASTQLCLSLALALSLPLLPSPSLCCV
jgi:hypothetical protein